MEDQDINQLLLDQEPPHKQVEYLEAPVITSTLIRTLLAKVLEANSPIIDGSQLMDAPMRLLKAKIMKEAFIKFIDGLMKGKSPMKQIIGLMLKAMFINATDGSMTDKLLTKLSKLPNATELLFPSTLQKTFMELSEGLTLSLNHNTEIVKNTDRMDFIQ
jgi:hypothetical protein